MFRHLRPVWAEINIDNLINNVDEIKRVAKDKELIAAIKADGYGHGAVDIAPFMLESGVNRFAVAVISEAIELRRNNIDAPIMILGYTPLIFGKDLLRYEIEQSVMSYEYCKELSDLAIEEKSIAKVHIALDTGMGRIGFIPNEESLEEIKKISELPNMKIVGMFSHFSTADEANKEYAITQLDKFKKFDEELQKRGIKIPMRHIANSAALIDIKDSIFEALRPGIILYGYYPSNEVNKNAIRLKPVMSLKTNIVHIKEVERGTSISYNRTFVTERKSKIATLPVGYADGYSRALSNKGKVIINGKIANIVGRVCMDQCMVDVTDIEDVKVGDDVVLMGEDSGLKIDAEDMAKLLDTISYEITCMISKRVPRVYIKDNKVIKIRNYV